MNDLACTYCGGELSLDYVFDGGSYSDYRTVVSIDCADCWAEWTPYGKATKDAKGNLLPDQP